MKQKIISLFFAFMVAIVVKAGIIEIDSIRHPLIIDGETAAPMVKPSEGCMPSRKATSSNISLQNTDDENFNLITTGTFTSTFFNNYRYTAELRQSDKNPNRFLITPFIDNDEGMIVEITHKKNDAGAYILKVTPAATGYEDHSYGMVSAYDAVSYVVCENSNFDGTTFRLNLTYWVTAGRFGEGAFFETFEIPAGLVTYTEGPNDDILFYSITNTSSREVSVVGLRDVERTALDIPGSVDMNGETYSVTSIGDEAFLDCSGLTSVTIPSSVTSIGYAAFADCSGLTNTTIPNSVTSIGGDAFYGCSGLTSVNIPNSVTSIGTGVFYNCSGLTSINIPNSVTSIGEYAFSGCSGLTSINIPNSVTSIGYAAFADCSGLTNITIPNSVTSIGGDAFYGCTGLTSIVVDEANTVYDSRDNCKAIIETKSNTLLFGCQSTTIPRSVTSIGEYAFSKCSGLTSINIPNSVTSIGIGAFYRCINLASLTIGNSVTSIGSIAFGWCESLTGDLVLPNSVTYIGMGAFFYCNGITSIFIPASVTTIEDGQTFASTKLESIKVDADNKVYDSREDCNAIIETAYNILIRGCKNTIIPNSVTSIGDYAFVNSIELTEIVIPSSVTYIGVMAFRGCPGLKNVYALHTDAAEYNCGSDAFESVAEATLHVPSGCRDSYANLAPWSAFGTIVDDIETAITHVESNRDAATYYNLQGQRLSEPQRGVNIIHHSDGTNKKVLVK